MKKLYLHEIGVDEAIRLEHVDASVRALVEEINGNLDYTAIDPNVRLSAKAYTGGLAPPLIGVGNAFREAYTCIPLSEHSSSYYASRTGDKTTWYGGRAVAGLGQPPIPSTGVVVARISMAYRRASENDGSGRNVLFYQGASLLGVLTAPMHASDDVNGWVVRGAVLGIPWNGGYIRAECSRGSGIGNVNPECFVACVELLVPHDPVA